MPWPRKKLEEIKKAWLVRWNFYSKDEYEQLRRCGINKKIVDIISVRKTFERVMDIVKDIYRREQLSYSEKIFLANYSKGKQREREYFSMTPVFTHHHTDLYRDYMRSFRENGMNSPITQKLSNQWRKYPIHVIIGNNPALEVRLVFNLTVTQNEDGNEVLEWDEPLVNGTYKREKYEI